VANSYLHEETELGTAGGLYKFREQILADGPESIFVLHCDIACPFPLKEMLAFHREKVRELGIVGTLLGSKVHYSADTTHDTRHTTHDTRHTTHDTRHTTHDTRHASKLAQLASCPGQPRVLPPLRLSGGGRPAQAAALRRYEDKTVD
jgi:hypothetical protein